MRIYLGTDHPAQYLLPPEVYVRSYRKGAYTGQAQDNMKIYLGTDHAGLEFKNEIKEYLAKEGYDVVDCGATTFDKDDDYPDFIGKVGQAVSEDPENHRGVVLGKSGAGEALVANKFKGVRAFLAVNEKNVQLAREHNDANVISLGSEIISLEDAKKFVKLFLDTKFPADERHVRRIKKISEIEEQGCSCGPGGCC